MSNVSQKTRIRQIAIIGGGVSGLSAAYFLEEASNIHVTLFEAGHRLGGNAVTFAAKAPDEHSYATDPVVYLFLKQRYPFFTAWLKQLGIKTSPFTFDNFFYDGYRRRSVVISNRLRRILTAPGFSLKYLWDLYSFRQVIKTINRMDGEGRLHDNLLMAEFESRVSGVRPGFFSEIFYPLMSFAFHCDPEQVPDMPCGATLRSYALVAKAPDAAYCIAGGVASYVDEVRRCLKTTRVLTGSRVISVRKNLSTGLWDLVSANGSEQSFDDIICANWPSQASEILGKYAQQTGGQLQQLVNAFTAVKQAWCRATIHNDTATMPAQKRSWTTYCYRHLPGMEHVAATIWSGQVARVPIFTSYDWANSSCCIPATPLSGAIHAVNVHFRTPPDKQLYIVRKMAHQQQGADGLWFVGSYLQGTGFHEDGLVSALEVVQQIEPSAHCLPRLKMLLETQQKL